MSIRSFIAVGLLVTGVLTTAIYADEAPKDHARLYAIASWGDLVATYGPGTDPAMDTPQAMENMIRYWKARGYTGVFMRTDLAQIEPLIRRNPITSSTESDLSGGNSSPRLAPLYKYIDRVMGSYEFQAVGEKLSRKYGFEWWAWHPYIYSDGAPEWAGSPGPGHIWPWTYVDKYKFEHPEIITVDRKGNKYWMVREFAYPGARQSKVAEFVYMAKTFGIKRFISCMRSEASQIQDPPDRADRYGFNQPVVDDMKRLYGVNIMTDPRFDVDLPSFNPLDPMVEKWHELRGSYVTQFYRDLRKALRAVDPKIELAVTLSGDTVGPPLGNWCLDWRTWVDEGLVDMIITPVTFEGSLDLDANKKGYLTDVRDGVGLVPDDVLRNYIAKSKHPEVKVIATDGPPYMISETPPRGADGWRIDAWYSAYHLAWYQRWWKQCFRDVQTQGYIRFLQQNFDDFPVGNVGYAGGWGDARYNPALHCCPGIWCTLGDGSDAKPTVSKQIVHGGSGESIKLTSNGDKQFPLIGFHRSFPDRSGIYSGIDNAITNGTATFEFWVYRATAGSGLLAYLQDTDVEHDVGLRITPGSGKLSYSTARKDGQPVWTDVDFVVPVGQWQRLEIGVDLDKRVYRGSAGEGQQAIELWKDIAIEDPGPRVVEHFNVGVPIQVPAYKMFRQVQFIPQGDVGGQVYLDDVAVNWTPTLYYTQQRSKVFFQDDFEHDAPGSTINNARTAQGGRWLTTSDAGTSAFTVTNDTSFGDGVNSLRATAGGTIIARGEPLRHIPDSIITVDLDMYVRSDRDYPYVMPDLNTTSRHRAIVGLRRKGTDDYAATVLVSQGTWWLWDGSHFVNTGVRVAYDVWNHVQIAIDAPSGTYRGVVQPVGEMPTLLGTARIGDAIVVNSDLEFCIETSETEGHLSLYDNVLVTAGARS
jgi:hypothetical protein